MPRPTPIIPEQHDAENLFQCLLDQFAQYVADSVKQLGREHAYEVAILREENAKLRLQLNGSIPASSLPVSLAGATEDTVFVENTPQSLTLDAATSEDVGFSQPPMPSPETPEDAPSVPAGELALGTYTSPGGCVSSSSQKCDPASSGLVALGLRGEWILAADFILRVSSRIEDSLAAETNVSIFYSLSHRRSNLDMTLNRFLCPLMHPESRRRCVWEFLGLVFISYDIVMVPMQPFEMAESPISLTMHWCTLLYWTIDILFCFLTGVFVDGQLIMSPRTIAEHYLKTWFVLDIVIVAGEWVGGQTSSLRFMRIYRLARLLRIVRVQRFLQNFKKRINSILLLLCLGIAKHISCIILVAHLLACGWYGIGKSQRSNGWVEGAFDGDSRVHYRYLTSLHWAVSQFHGSMEINPSSSPERVYAVSVLFFALVIFSWLVSSMTNAMIELQSMRHEQQVQNWALLTFLKERRISQGLSYRVKEYIASQKGKEKREHEVAWLSNLPENLVMDIHEETRAPILSGHGLFFLAQIDYPRAYRNICHQSVHQRSFASCDMVFTTGDACDKMFFVELGRLHYVLGVRSHSSQRIKPARGGTDAGKGQWLAEIALWCVWENAGDLSALGDSSLLLVDVAAFAGVVRRYEKLHLEVATYAKNFAEEADTGGCSDLGTRELVDCPKPKTPHHKIRQLRLRPFSKAKTVKCLEEAQSGLEHDCTRPC